MEIDEYRDYEKSIGALREALKYLKKAETRQAAEMAQHMEQRINCIVRFVEAKHASEEEEGSQNVVSLCEGLLQDPNIEEAVRLGDIFALLVEYLSLKGHYEDAYRYLQSMQDRGITPLQSYIDPQVLSTVLKALGLSAVGSANKRRTSAAGAETVQSRGENKFNESDEDVDERKEDEGVGSELDEEIDEVILLLYHATSQSRLYYEDDSTEITIP